MQRRLNQKRWIPVLESIRSSYWFLPSSMALAAAGFALGTITIDAHVSGDPVPWLYAGGAEGARAILGTLAGSMITVAGVVFSITIVAMSLASQQFGPMLLRNFMHDRSNQLVLGAFVATFVYCLLVLRSVRGGEGGGGFVPHLSTTVAILLGGISIGVLIFFIHHIARSIRIETVLSRVATDLDRSVDELFPEQVGKHGGGADLEALLREPALEVRATSDGYLLALDDELLVERARESDVVVEVVARPHDFVVAETCLFRIRPRDRASEELSEAFRDAVVLGTDRTTAQDIRFGLDQLVQLGLRALSPSLNDPLTARDVVDRLVSAIARIVRHGLPQACRYDDAGDLRVVAPAVSFEELLERGLEPIRRNATDNVMVVRHLIASAEKLEASVRDAEQRDVLHAFVQRIGVTAREELAPADWEAVEPLLREALARIVQPHHAESRTGLVTSGGAPGRAG